MIRCYAVAGATTRQLAATTSASRYDDELALHQRDQALGAVEVGAREVIEHLLQLAVIEHELEGVELDRRQVAQLAGERRRHRERRAERRQVALQVPELVELAHA